MNTFGTNWANATNLALDSSLKALLGIWKLCLADSVFPKDVPEGMRNKAQIRTFGFTDGPMLLCTFLGSRVDGLVYHGHWTSSLDGVPRPEFTSLRGTDVHYMVQFVASGEREFSLQSTNAGKPAITGKFMISDDGQRLEYRYRYVERDATEKETLAVYRQWAPE